MNTGYTMTLRKQVQYFSLSILMGIGAAAVQAQDIQVRIRLGDIHDEHLIRLNSPSFSTPSRLPSGDQLAMLKIDSELAAAAENLDHADWTIRQEAENMLTRHISPSGGETLQLLAILEKGDLSSEQRHRLLQIVRQRLVNAPRGAMGIQMSVTRLGGPVTITHLLPGMPAAEVLKEDDRIVAIDGVPIRSSEELIRMVQSRRPGERVDLLIERPRRRVDGRVLLNAMNQPIYDRLHEKLELGAAEDLEQFNTPLRNPRPNAIEIERAQQAEEAFMRYAPRIARVEIADRQFSAVSTQ